MSALSDRVLGPLLKAGLTGLSKRRLPRIDGTLKVAGLTGSVEVIRDRWSVPHIYAGNSHDLFIAQGFVHAQERLWQMELNRRAAEGRLSEIIGDLALDTDRAVRIFGFNRLAKTDWERASEETQGIIRAYCDGINAFLASSAPLPIEFTLLRFRPEKWQPEDTMAFARLFIWQLSSAWCGEIIRARLIEAVGTEHAAELEIRYPAGNPLTLPEGIEFNRLDIGGVLRAMNGPFLKSSLGSNAMTVAGSRSATGHPILCSDMHLAVSVPSRWYENHLAAGEINVTGASLPGAPLVIVGHNARVAWGCTLAYTDCEDLFVEEFSSDNPDTYRFRGEHLRAEIIPEAIEIKGRKPLIEKVTVTRHGPVISDAVAYPERRVALCSMALLPCQALTGWVNLNKAAGWNDFVGAMRLIEAPPLNIVYADVEGNTGHWVTGKVPVRAKGRGMLPAPGWDGEYEWIGEVPFEEMPHALNPGQGYVVTCNNKIVLSDFTYYLGDAWANGYRARCITDLIESLDKVTAADLNAMCTSVISLPGLELVKRLEGFETDDPDAGVALRLLRAWDGSLSAASVGGAVYEVARYKLVRLLLEPALGKALTDGVMGVSFNEVLKTAHEFYSQETLTVLRMLDDPVSWWLKQAGGRQKALTECLKQAATWLRGKLGADESKWQWGSIHRLTYPNAMGLKKPLDLIFNRGPYPVGGDSDTPFQTALAADAPYDARWWCPSFRQVVDMQELARSRSIHTPGQSGQLGSRHYDDFIAPWLRGQSHPMLWHKADIEQATEGKLTLQP